MFCGGQIFTFFGQPLHELVGGHFNLDNLYFVDAFIVTNVNGVFLIWQENVTLIPIFVNYINSNFDNLQFTYNVVFVVYCVFGFNIKWGHIYK